MTDLFQWWTLFIVTWLTGRKGLASGCRVEEPFYQILVSKWYSNVVLGNNKQVYKRYTNTDVTHMHKSKSPNHSIQMNWLALGNIWSCRLSMTSVYMGSYYILCTITSLLFGLHNQFENTSSLLCSDNVMCNVYGRFFSEKWLEEFSTAYENDENVLCLCKQLEAMKSCLML